MLDFYGKFINRLISLTLDYRFENVLQIKLHTHTFTHTHEGIHIKETIF